MTRTQWIWEIEALQEREKEEQDRIIDIIKIAKKLIIQLFGLDLVYTYYDQQLDQEDKREEDYDNKPFLPLIMAVGRDEIITYLTKKIDESEKLREAISDEEFDKLSDAIASGDMDIGDMEPMIDEDVIKETIEKARKRDLEALGVKFRERSKENKSMHFSVDTKEMQEKLNKAKLATEEANREIDKIVEHNKKSDKKKLVTFDA